MSSRQLGYLFLAPALLFVVVFFFAPVVLTAVFSFTNMSTATGISGGAYQIDPNVLRELRTEHGQDTLSESLDRRSYVVDDRGLAALEEIGIGDALIGEIRTKFAGETWLSRRDFEGELRRLDNRPRSARDIKAISAEFERSVLGTRFETEAALFSAVERLGVELGAAQRDALAEAAYTGWRYTTENFTRMVSVPDTTRTMINTLFYVFAVLVLFNTGFAMVLAVTTHYLPERPAGVYRSLWLLPRVLPPVIFVLMWKWLAWDTGFISALLEPFGVPPRNWMMHTATNAWVFVVLINGVVGASMGMLIFSSAIKAIPTQIFFASEVDGASRWQQVRYIILPQLRWPVLFITTYQTLSLLASYEYILLSTNGGPGGQTEVWALAAYHTALQNYAGNLAYGYGAALALVLVVVGIVVSLGYLFFLDFRSLVRPPRIER